MPNRCSVCNHAQAVAVEALIATGVSRQRVADTFALGRKAVQRHVQQGHVQRLAVAAGRRRVQPATTTPASVASPGSPTVEYMAPADVFREAMKEEPLSWQVDLWGEARDTVVLKGRQVGASTASSILAVSVASSAAGVDVVIVSPSQRQSGEITQKVRLACWEVGLKLRADSAAMVQLDNGSRVISLPGVARGIRGYAPKLVIADEAAWISDDTWDAMRPMIAASGGRLIVLSTPGVEGVGWFWKLATDTPDDWRRMVVPSTTVPTISAEFLAREKAQMEPHVYAAEYLAEFQPAGADVIRGTWFTEDAFDQRVDDRFEALKF